ncbi:hypothetical protein ABT270_05725 [Streptomyces sp900105245]|uniref:beta family protein n=1 Tax=Streptomyces sp. 900105245 TaxID=3154379 RepID=UPI00332B8085
MARDRHAVRRPPRRRRGAPGSRPGRYGPRGLGHVARDRRERAVYAKLVRYGDYGIPPVRNIGRAVDDGDRSPYGLLRYTTERTSLQQGSGPRNGARREPPARRLVGSPYSPTSMARVRVRATARTEQCARTTGAKGTGNAGTWNTLGNIQHMTYVVRCSTRVAD